MDIEKEKIHTRNIVADGYRRSDGLYEIKATINDCKHYEFKNEHLGIVKPGQYFHHMTVTLVLDNKLTIKEISAETLASPFAICPEITKNYKKLIGIQIGLGWHRSVKKCVGHTNGCTHITELLLYIGTVAIQTIYSDLRRDKKTPADESSDFGKGLINSCHAWSESSPVTEKFLPEHYISNN